MKRPPRHGLVAIATLMSLALFSSCGGDDDSATSTSTTDPTTNTSIAPAPSSTTPATLTPITDPPTTPPTSEPAASTYTIVAGDSLYAIAEQNEVSLDALVAANGWSDGIDHLILPGDVIKLPTAGSEPSGDGGSTENTSGDDGG